MQPASDGSAENGGSGGGSSTLRRYGPIAGIVVVIAVVAAVVVFSSSGDDDEAADTATGNTSGITVVTGEGTFDLPEGVLPFSVAEEEGIDVDWPDTCDTERGTIAVPSFFAAECYAPYEGEPGGASDQGITEDSIRIVLYQIQEPDEIFDAIAGAASADTNAGVEETLRKLIEYYETYYETYGRNVELIVYEGTGGWIDPVVARADAAQIAELEPFQVWGAPLPNDFVDELVGRDIQTVQLLQGQPQEYFAEQDPLIFSIGMSPLQNRVHVSEYIGKRLAGEPAVQAGDPAMHDQERVFGLVYQDLEADASASVTTSQFEEFLGEYDTGFATTISYPENITLQSTAPSVIAKLKEEGVTTVVFTGDPLSPGILTREATLQDYHPEWIVAGSALVDTTVYARTYDQEQWAHAFGVSNGNARVERDVASTHFLYEWFHCSPPPAPDSIVLTQATPTTFYTVLQALGPNPTRQGFRDALFNADPTGRAITNPSLSWGEKDRWPVLDGPDYHGVDDATEVWWDPDATGIDETGDEGTGMYRYVDGGTRYLPGEWPDTAPDAFVEEGSVTIYDAPPTEEQFPDYPSPCE